MGALFAPRFLEGVKALTSIVRDASMSKHWCKSLRDDGLELIASLIEGLSVPSFADWRWHKFEDILVAHEHAIHSIKAAWDPRIFGQVKFRERVEAVTRMFARPAFLTEFRFCVRCVQYVGELMRWIGGCDCPEHQEVFSTDCWKRGRRMQTAYQEAMRTFQDMLDECNAWGVDWFDGSWALMMSAQRCVRFAFAVRTWTKYLGCLSAHSSLASFGDAKCNGKADPLRSTTS